LRYCAFVAIQALAELEFHGVGGALLIEGGSPRVESCSFIGNRATSEVCNNKSCHSGDGRGGAVAVLGGSLKFLRCWLRGSEAIGGENRKSGGPETVVEEPCTSTERT
jgi:hypothetical protein